MPKRKARGSAYGISPEDAVRKLLEWNPHWCRHTIEAYPVKQLYAIYYSEQQKTVKQIFASIGANY